MTAPVILPAARMVRNQPFFHAVALRTADGSGGRVAVDISGWSAEFTAAHALDDPPIVRVVPGLTSDGLCLTEIPAAETLLFLSAPRLGGRVAGVFQIILTDPEAPEMPHVFQGALSIAESLK